MDVVQESPRSDAVYLKQRQAKVADLDERPNAHLEKLTFGV